MSIYCIQQHELTIRDSFWNDGDIEDEQASEQIGGNGPGYLGAVSKVLLFFLPQYGRRHQLVDPPGRHISFAFQRRFDATPS